LLRNNGYPNELTGEVLLLRQILLVSLGGGEEANKGPENWGMLEDSAIKFWCANWLFYSSFLISDGVLTTEHVGKTGVK